MNERAILYRKMEGIPDEWGTAVSVMAMVFGNMGETSATGVCFSRDAGNGENLFNGEYLINAQGEDVVAGIRTPQQITKIGSQRWAERAGISEEERVAKYPSMEEAMPELYKELDALQDKLEHHYHDMQDMEFTVQEGKLWFLQTRNGKRTGTAMVKIAMDLLHEGMIDEKTAILAVSLRSSMSFCTQYSISWRSLELRSSLRVSLLLQVLLAVRSYSTLTMLRSGTRMARRSSWFVSRLPLKTSLVCQLPRVSLPLVVV